MQIQIDEKKILTEILEQDGSLHESIKREVRNDLVEKLTREIEDEYFNTKWSGTKEIADRILEDLKLKQTEVVKTILKEFYESYRYKKNDIKILQKLKEFLKIDY